MKPSLTMIAFLWAIGCDPVTAQLAPIAKPVIGPDYTAEEIRSFSIAGLTVGMSEDEARKSLESSGFEGSFVKFTGTEHNGKFWVRLDQGIVPFRVTDSSGVAHIYELQFQQKFERPQSIDALKAMVVGKYGQPSELENPNPPNQSLYPATLKYHVAYHTDHSFCSGGTTFCQDADTFSKELDEPTLVVTIAPNLLRATLSDTKYRKLQEDATNKAATDFVEKKSKANSKSTKLGL